MYGQSSGGRAAILQQLLMRAFYVYISLSVGFTKVYLAGRRLLYDNIVKRYASVMKRVSVVYTDSCKAKCIQHIPLSLLYADWLGECFFAKRGAVLSLLRSSCSNVAETADTAAKRVTVRESWGGDVLLLLSGGDSTSKDWAGGRALDVRVGNGECWVDVTSSFNWLGGGVGGLTPRELVAVLFALKRVSAADAVRVLQLRNLEASIMLDATLDEVIAHDGVPIGMAS